MYGALASFGGLQVLLAYGAVKLSTVAAHMERTTGLL